MWWILRRARLTGASFFSQATGGSNNNNNKPDPRPPRKNYNQLSSNEKLDNAASSGHCDGRCEDADGDADADAVTDADADADSDVSSEPEGRRARRCPARVCPHDRYNNNVRQHDDFSDDTDYDEALTCNVCDRSFPTRRQLADHQQKKRHFGCGACDSLFPSLMALEHHKEEFQHWSDSSWCSNSGSSEPDLEPDSDAELDKHRLL